MMTNQLLYQKIFTGNPAEIPKALNWFDAIFLDLEMKPNIVFNLKLCFEELFTNIVKHGSANNLITSNNDRCIIENNIIIEVIISITAEKLRLTLEDNSIPFNIKAIETNGINKPLEQLKPGGLGIHLVKNIADYLYYTPLNSGNRVVLEFNCAS